MPYLVKKIQNCSGAAGLLVSWAKPREENVLRMGCLVSESRDAQRGYATQLLLRPGGDKKRVENHGEALKAIRQS